MDLKINKPINNNKVVCEWSSTHRHKHPKIYEKTLTEK